MDVKRLRKLGIAATQEPWDYRSTSNPKMNDGDRDKPIWRINTYWPDGRINSGPGFVRADCEFIVAAQKYWTTLLNIVEAADNLVVVNNKIDMIERAVQLESALEDLKAID